MSSELEKLILHLGRPGRYQTLVFSLLQLQYVFVVSMLFSLSFWTYRPSDSCKALNISEVTTHLLDTQDGTQKALFTSLAMEWNLLCDEKRYLLALLQTLFFCGTMLGGMIFGPIADSLGRKKVSFATALMTSVFIGVGSFIEEFYTFATLKVLQGVFIQGFVSASTCMKAELFHGKYRALFLVMGDAVALCLGTFYLTGITFITRNWRYVELGLCIPLLLSIGFYWMVPESLRWLLKAKKSNGALKIVEHIAKKNGLPLPDNVQNMIDTIMLEMDQDLRRQKEYDIRDLFRRRRMAIYTLIFSFSWLIMYLANYGIMFTLANLSGNIFINFIILGAIDLLFRGMSLIFLRRWESKYLSSLGLSTMGVLLAIVALMLTGIGIPKSTVAVATTVLEILARAFIGFFVVSAYVLQSEVFPTPLRATAYGLFSASGRIGALLSSQVIALGTLTWKGLPFAMLGFFGVVTGISNLSLPETRGKPMPNSIQDTLTLHKPIQSNTAAEMEIKERANLGLTESNRLR